MRGLTGVTVNDASIVFTDFLGTATGVNKGQRLLNAWNPSKFKFNHSSSVFGKCQ